MAPAIAATVTRHARESDVDGLVVRQSRPAELIVFLIPSINGAERARSRQSGCKSLVRKQTRVRQMVRSLFPGTRDVHVKFIGRNAYVEIPSIAD
jgi:hypothetical protein